LYGLGEDLGLKCPVKYLPRPIASDNVLAFDVITATGEQTEVGPDKYPDLFWALKGGGPSTYAVVTSVTVKTFPTVPVTGESSRLVFSAV
jgi:FAD/FMN-containing dehydrogenase